MMIELLTKTMTAPKYGVMPQFHLTWDVLTPMVMVMLMWMIPTLQMPLNGEIKMVMVLEIIL